MGLTQTVYTSVVNYNHLEALFLVAAVMIMMTGMVFSSNGLSPGSTLYNAVAAAAAVIIVSSVSIFACLMSFEVYRSLKFAKLNDIARRVEVDRMEQSLAASTRGLKTLSRQAAPRRSFSRPGATAGPADGGRSERAKALSQYKYK